MPLVIAKILDHIDTLQFSIEEESRKQLLQHLQRQTPSILKLIKTAQTFEFQLQAQITEFERALSSKRNIAQEVDYITQQAKEYAQAFLLLIEEIL